MLSQNLYLEDFCAEAKRTAMVLPYGASEIYPEAWKGFIEEITEDKRSNLIEAYREIFNGEDQEKT